MILSKTPVRIAFGGGGTDVEKYSSENTGYVVNVTINNYIRSFLHKSAEKIIKITLSNKFSTYKLEELNSFVQKDISSDLIKAILFLLKPKIGMDIYIHGEPPERAGLGGSASLSTSLIAGILKLNNKPINLNGIAEMAFIIEQNYLKNAGGRQDQYASLYGGFNGIEFLGNSNVKVNRLKLSKTFKQKIEKNLILYYTGSPHISGDLVSLQVELYKKNKFESKKSLDILKEIAYQIRDSLISEEFETFGKLLSKDLSVKTAFNPSIRTEYMKKLNELVMNNGGIGGRICGAGGGGCMIWLISPKSRNKVIDLLNQQSGMIIEYKFVDKGLEIIDI